MEYKDFSFEMDDFGKAKEYSGTNAFILAIRNILLSRPGNYPFTPDLGLDISQYEFEFCDDATLSDIKSKMLQQINKFIPSIDDIALTVDKIETQVKGKTIVALGISVSVVKDGENITSNFLVTKENEVVEVYNETSK